MIIFCSVTINLFCFQIEDYILQEEKDVPLLLLGRPGCGKSSILCQAADVIIKKVENEEIHV